MFGLVWVGPGLPELPSLAEDKDPWKLSDGPTAGFPGVEAVKLEGVVWALSWTESNPDSDESLFQTASSIVFKG